jgi:hypothetical protein
LSELPLNRKVAKVKYAVVYIYVMSRMAFLGRFFSIMATIRSCPGALCGVSRYIAFFISTVVKALTGSDSWQGAFR